MANSYRSDSMDDCSRDDCPESGAGHRYPSSTTSSYSDHRSSGHIIDATTTSSDAIIIRSRHLMPHMNAERLSHSMHNIVNGSIDMKRRKRKANPIPTENKDDAYWERRKRNNESAKRSREVRRVKEYHSNARLMYLEEENIKLRTEVNTLRDEIGNLRQLLHCNGCSHQS